MRLTSFPHHTRGHALRSPTLLPVLSEKQASARSGCLNVNHGHAAFADIHAAHMAGRLHQGLPLICRRGFLGWQHNVRGVPVEELSLRAAIPSAEREGVALAFEYIQWLLAERQISVRTEGLVIRSVMAAAKHVHHDKSQARGLRCQLLRPPRFQRKDDLRAANRKVAALVCRLLGADDACSLME